MPLCAQGKVAVETMGGPVIPWRPGRVDYVDGEKTPPDGRLPETNIGIRNPVT